MIKKLSILLLAGLCSFGLSAQHKRRVLIEEFTNASCGPCAAQNPAFNAVIAANMQYLTPIKYQVNFPGFDPMNVQTQSDVEPRRNYYAVNGVPNGRQNGTLEVFPMNSYTAGMIQTAYNNLTPVTMSAIHSLNAAMDSVTVTVSVTSDADLSGTLRLRIAVVEDVINFDEAPGSNGETEFFQIMRKMLPSATGASTGNFAAGETKTYTYQWKLDHFYNLNQMSIAAFLQNDATKEVFQSVRSEPLGLNLVDDQAFIPSKKVFACAPGYSPSFTLVNQGNETLSSVDMVYRQGTGAWTPLNWTGNLAPGASEDINLSAIVINDPGIVNVQVALLRSNLGTQIDFANDIATIKVITAFNTPSPLPFSNTFQSALFPPVGWTNDANDVAYNWKLATNAGSASSRSARCSLFITPAGERSILITPKIDLSTATGTTKLTFDHAYTYFNNNLFDSLRIQVSSNCGLDWKTVFHDGKVGLATAPPYSDVNNGWVPSAAEWRANNEIDISDFNGNPEVLIRFIAESGFGNNMYLDNVNITSTVGTKELVLTQLNLAPNPSRSFTELRFDLEKTQEVTLQVFNQLGVLVYNEALGELSSGDHRVALSASTFAAGNYQVVLQGQDGVSQTQWVVLK